jgi:hypothetical protein
MVRGSSKRGCHRAPPNRETGEGGGALTGGRTPMSGGWSGHWAKGTWCGGRGLAEESIERRIGQGGLNTCADTRRSGKCHCTPGRGRWQARLSDGWWSSEVRLSVQGSSRRWWQLGVVRERLSARRCGTGRARAC